MGTLGIAYELGFPTNDPFASRPTTYGVTRPNATNTGIVIAPSLTRTSQGALTVTTSGTQTWNNVDFHGDVIIQASGLKYFKNCRFYGGTTTSNTGCVDCRHVNVSNVVLEDCQMIPATPSLWYDGVIGHHYTMTRCNVQNVVDGAGVYNNNSGHETDPTGVVIQMCRFSNFGWWNPDPNQTDGSHSDGTQMQGGDGTQILGNSYEGYFNTSIGNSPWGRHTDDTQHRNLSGLMFTPNVGAITNTVVDKNWFDGSEIMVNAASSANGGHNLGTFTNNRFGKNSYFSGYTLDFYHTATWTQSGNVYYVDNSAITVHTA